MNNKRTICIVSSSRADYNHLYLLIKEVNKSPLLNLKILVTGMHMIKEHGLTYKEILQDGFTIEKKIHTYQKHYNESDVLAAMSSILKSSNNAFKKIKPDIVVVLGDRYDIFPICIACHIMQIPLAHLHGGEVTIGAIDDAIRHSISKMSDIHFTAHIDFKRRLIQLGENPRHIYNIGSLGIDAIKKIKYKSQKYIYDKYNLKNSSKYFLICLHPETIAKDPSSSIINLLRYIDDHKDDDYIFTYPNSDTNSNIILSHIKKYVSNNKNCHLIKSAGRYDFLHLLKYSLGILGNSSSGIVEAPSLNVPTLNIGSRQSGRPFGKSIFHATSSLKSIQKEMSRLKKSHKKTKIIKSVYQGKNAVHRIIKILSNIKLSDLKSKKFNDVKYELQK